MIVMIDNYDSFTFNLVQEMGRMGAEMTVYRNDRITLAELRAQEPTALIISPGPCTPSQAGISVEAVRHFSGRIPLLGVCLGHQAIVQAFGGTVRHARAIMHGKTSPVRHTDDALFAGVENPFDGGRYHSLVGQREDWPDCLRITAETEDGEVMGLHHREHPTYGVQFHPESVLTPAGNRIMGNFLALIS